MSVRHPDFVITLPATVSLPIVGADQRFPIGRIFCVGRNYAEHAREMGGDPNREPPFFFMKPASALVADGEDVPYPTQSADLHHEVEVVIAIGIGGTHIAVDQAPRHVYGYAVGVDLTCRDLQNRAKKAGRPWETSKAFDGSAPCSAVRRASDLGHPSAGPLELRVNGVLRQQGEIGQMIWNVPEIIAHLSTYFALQPGDLIFTGTPSGVGAIKIGDLIEATAPIIGELSFNILERSSGAEGAR
jgi:fumarylpyruvate hydrolase